jgi:hypothetical protein
MRIVCQEAVDVLGCESLGGTVENTALALGHHYFRFAFGRQLENGALCYGNDLFHEPEKRLIESMASQMLHELTHFLYL